MRELPRIWRKLMAPAIIYIMFFVGIVGHIVPATHDLMILLTPFFLFGMGLFVIHRSLIRKEKGFLAWVCVTYVITFGLEAVGVATGLVFGEYWYGDTLGPMLFDVPVVIGFNWVLVVVGAVLVARKLTGNIYLASGLGGIISTVFDIFLEPVAIELDYWQWQGGTIPLQNYMAWFVIATVFSFGFLKMDIGRKKDLAIHYLFVQALFFLILQLAFNM